MAKKKSVKHQKRRTPQRRYLRNQLSSTNRLIGDTTRAMVGLTVLTSATNMASTLLKP